MRRKAINVELIRESNSNPGYFKYEITIQNSDGSIEVIPTYGKDLQSAIKRLIHDENAKPVVNLLNKTRFMWLFVGLGWFAYICLLALINAYVITSPLVFVGGFIFALGIIIYSYFRLEAKNDKIELQENE